MREKKLILRWADTKKMLEHEKWNERDGKVGRKRQTMRLLGQQYGQNKRRT